MVKKWHYLAIKNLSALFQGITSKHDGDIYPLNCLHSFRTKSKLKKYKSVSKNHKYRYIEMPKECYNMLKLNHGEKYMKVQFIVYADLESFLKNRNLT